MDSSYIRILWIIYYRDWYTGLIMMAMESQILPTMTIQFIDLTVQLLQRQYELWEQQQPWVLDLVPIKVSKLLREKKWNDNDKCKWWIIEIDLWTWLWWRWNPRSWHDWLWQSYSFQKEPEEEEELKEKQETMIQQLEASFTETNDLWKFEPHQ